MTLTRYRLGDLIEKYDKKCNIPDLTIYDISGINRDKEFFEPSKQVGKNTSNYKNVPIGFFATNLMHVGRDVVLPIAYNHSSKNKIVSPAYTVFKVKDNVDLIDQFLFIYFNSDQRDRYFWFSTDASIRDGLSWEDFCDIKIDLPPLDIQKKYVAIYKAMLENQESYEKGLEDLKLACDAALDIVSKKNNSEYLGDFIQKSEYKNIENKFNKSHIRGISIDKKFIETKANLESVNVKNYRVVKQNEFAFVTVTSRNSEKISLAMNQSNDIYLCSSTYVVFKVIDNSKLNPSYLLLNFTKKQFNRYVRFNSWGSARETFDYSDMEQVKIPIPPIEIQNSIANIYRVYTERKEINEKLKERLKNICPILIKGAVEEANRKEA